ncbi:MAG: S-layer homology domain-containing protein, partial [Oscillospiraceae bacterium]|nr:S-layer homology domain-containing protein [Oscillospiraceae bacterium]
AGYEDFTDKDKITHKQAVQTLVELNIINGKEDGSYYDPQGTLTRAEAAKLVCVVLNGGKEPVLGDPDSVSYKDTKGTWAAAYIEYVSSLGIVAGDGQGYFKPTDTVTASQLAKMLLVAIGYDAEFEGMVGSQWQSKTDALANRNNLYAELDGLVTSNPLNRDDAAQIIYNAMDALLVRYQSAGENGAVGTVADPTNETVLSRYFNTDTVVGVVVANDIFAVDGTKAPTDKIKVEVRTVNSENDGGLITLPVDVDNDLVGQEVTVYVKNLGKTTQTVIGGVVPTEKNVIVITTEALKDNKKVDDFLKKSDLSIDNAALIWNGVIDTYDDIYNDALLNEFGGMERKLIDNNDDGDADYVLVLEKTLTKVTAYDTKNENLKLDGSDEKIAFEDTEITGTIAKNDYVLAVDFNGLLYIEKAETVNGKVEKVNTTNYNITVDGKDYAMSWLDEATDLDWSYPSAALINKTYDFYLDNDGNVIAWGKPIGAAREYGLVIAAGSEADILHNSSSAVKMVLADGSQKVFYVDLKATADNINDTFDADITEDEVAEFIDEMGYFVGDELYGFLVAYTLNDDGTITLNTGDNDSWMLMMDPEGEDGNGEYATRTNSTYTDGPISALASNSTIYFFYNTETEEYSVISGIGKLPLKDDETLVRQVAAADDDGSIIAEAAFICGVVETEGDYAYVLDGYTINADKDLEYTVIKADASTDTIVVDKNNAIEEGLYKLVNINDKTEAREDEHIQSGIVTQISGDGSTMVTDGGNFTIASDVKVVDITDTDAPAAIEITDVAAGNAIFFITDDDGLITTIFVNTDAADEGTVEPEPTELPEPPVPTAVPADPVPTDEPTPEPSDETPTITPNDY